MTLTMKAMLKSIILIIGSTFSFIDLFISFIFFVNKSLQANKIHNTNTITVKFNIHISFYLKNFNIA